MAARIIKEITYEYDQEGRVIKKTITETTEEDRSVHCPSYPYYPPSYVFAGTPVNDDTATMLS